jgi:hypothetical protein
MKDFSPGRQLSRSHARNLSVCADLQHVDQLVQSKQFVYLKPLRVAILHQDCMNIDMQLVNKFGWRRSPKWAREWARWQVALESGSSIKRSRCRQFHGEEIDLLK